MASTSLQQRLLSAQAAQHFSIVLRISCSLPLRRPSLHLQHPHTPRQLRQHPRQLHPWQVRRTATTVPTWVASCMPSGHDRRNQLILLYQKLEGRLSALGLLAAPSTQEAASPPAPGSPAAARSPPVVALDCLMDAILAADRSDGKASYEASAPLLQLRAKLE